MSESRDAPPLRVVCIGCGGPVMTRDATDVATAMRRLANRHTTHPNVTLLVGQDATRDAVCSALAGMLTNECEADHPPVSTIAVYFSGHAKKDAHDELWLLVNKRSRSSNRTKPSASQEQQHLRPSKRESRGSPTWARRGISASELRKACLTSPANVLLILDCCYAGSIVQTNQQQQGKRSRKWHAGADTPGRVFVASSGASDPTHYIRGAKNSPLTAAILQVVNDGPNDTNRKVLSARNLARAVQSVEHVRIEERGRDFSLVSTKTKKLARNGRHRSSPDTNGRRR